MILYSLDCLYHFSYFDTSETYSQKMSGGTNAWHRLGFASCVEGAGSANHCQILNCRTAALREMLLILCVWHRRNQRNLCQQFCQGRGLRPPESTMPNLAGQHWGSESQIHWIPRWIGVETSGELPLKAPLLASILHLLATFGHYVLTPRNAGLPLNAPPLRLGYTQWQPGLASQALACCRPESNSVMRHRPGPGREKIRKRYWYLNLYWYDIMIWSDSNMRLPEQ